MKPVDRSRFRALTVACMLAFAACAWARSQAHAGFVVAGYVFPRNTLLQPGQIDARNMTRINFAFAAINHGRLAEGAETDAQNLALLARLRKQNPALTVLASVGGWLGSGGFSDVALTARSRSVFIESAVNFLKRYDLDGLDVDWEYPGMAGAGHSFRAEDKQNFTLLLEELRKRFNVETKSRGRHLVLTIAAGASDDYLAHTEIKKVQPFVDAVNLMAYDYSLPSVDAVTGHNAPLFANPAAPKRGSVDASVEAFERAGVPARKIVVGVPFYGHAWSHVADENHGLFQPGAPAADDFAPFSLIEGTMLGHGFTRYWDDAASVPYLYSAERREFVSYEDVASLAIKCGYVEAHKLQGMMFWEYSDDPSGALQETIARALGLSRSSRP